jgi:hypothetical protein
MMKVVCPWVPVMRSSLSPSFLVVVLVAVSNEGSAQELRSPTLTSNQRRVCPESLPELPAIEWQPLIRSVGGPAGRDFQGSVRDLAQSGDCAKRTVDLLQRLSGVVRDWVDSHSDVRSLGLEPSLEHVALVDVKALRISDGLRGFGCLGVVEGWRIDADIGRNECVVTTPSCGVVKDHIAVPAIRSAATAFAARCVAPKDPDQCMASVSAVVLDVGTRVRVRMHVRQSLVIEIVGRSCAEVVLDCPLDAVFCVPKVACSALCRKP